MMDIQERLRRYGRDSRLLGEYRSELNALDTNDPKWSDAFYWLEQTEQDVAKHEEALVAAGMMCDSDRYIHGRIV